MVLFLSLKTSQNDDLRLRYLREEVQNETRLGESSQMESCAWPYWPSVGGAKNNQLLRAIKKKTQANDATDMDIEIQSIPSDHATDMDIEMQATSSTKHPAPKEAEVESFKLTFQAIAT